LFTASKGKSRNCTVWFAATGERLGTYDGHAGAVFGMDVSYDSSLLVTASGDSSTLLWNVRTGEQLARFKHDTPARWTNFAMGEKRFLTVTKGVMGKTPEILIYQIENPFDIRSTEPITRIPGKAQFVKAYWGPLNENIYACCANGAIYVFDAESGEEKSMIEPHTKEITGFEFSHCKQYFVTASKDNTGKMFDTATLECLKTFVSGRPLNDIAISPLKPHVFVVGGQDVATVTTAHADSAQFKARVYHSVHEVEIGTIQGHFAPVNSITVSPDGKTMVTGGEDGYARVNTLDKSYFEGLSDEVLFPMEEPEL